MKFSLMLILSCLILCSCRAKQDREAEEKNVAVEERSSEGLQKSLEVAPPVGDSILLPPFEIEVALSERADRELQAANETIIVQAFFQGIPRDTTLEEYAEWGEIFVGESRVELEGGERVASFDSPHEKTPD
ncbi:MAG: hypothetical protein AB7H80_14280 [Candidatus Kapaibacterium sp.]